VPQVINVDQLDWPFQKIVELLNKVITISDASEEVYFYGLWFLLGQAIALLLKGFKLFDHAVH